MITDKMAKYLLFIISQIQSNYWKNHDPATNPKLLSYCRFLSKKFKQIIHDDRYNYASDIIVKMKEYDKGEVGICEVEAKFVFYPYTN